MRHQGVAFPPEYEPLGLSVRIKDQVVQLAPLQEEMLMAWAKKLTTPYVQDQVFRENFLNSLRQVSTDNHFPFTFESVALEDIDLTAMAEIAERQKLANMPEEERKAESARRKQLRDELKLKYGQAIVDGKPVDIAAYLVEPPGIFMGRGAHPLRGTWKPRVYPEEVELNLDEDADPPHPMLDGHEWKGVVHEHDGLWVARWKDVLADKTKYVWLAETSHLRQEKEKEKYEKAARLKSNLKAIRKHIREGMQARDERTRRAATVACLIDTLAMRVGDEKDEDEADTVGASTLRVEHVLFHPDRIEFDFLGKDSVRWEKDLPITPDTRLLEKNLREFVEGKAPDEQIFHDISSQQVNDFLRKGMPGLSAKVFRTFHATTTVDDYLGEHRPHKSAMLAEKDYIARMANLQAAITCNHKRTVPKNYEENLKKREEQLNKLRAAKPDVGRLDAQIKAREKALEELQAQQRKFETESPALVAKKEHALKKLEAEPVPESDAGKAKLAKRKKTALKAVLEANKINRARARRFKERIKKATEALAQARAARYKAKTQYEERVARAKYQLDLARETKDYNLNTSLKNYIDPRKYRDWGEKVGYDWTRLYTTALRRKFKWAIEEEEEDDTDNGDGEEPEVEQPTTAQPQPVSVTNGNGNEPEPTAEKRDTQAKAQNG